MAKASRSRPGSDTEDPIVAALDRMTEEVRVLRQVIDELREEIQWAARNVVGEPLPRLPTRRITSMPLDPTCDDFAERLNALTPADLPPNTPAMTAPTDRGVLAEPPAKASRTAEATESVDGLAYCCDKPELKWYGDPESPGIECANCQFPVAQEGEILCWRSTDEVHESKEQADAPAEARQHELF